MDSFGERLKREREKRGVTLDEISVATKIGTRMLRALEEEKFDQLPGGIFNKGFVRAYAQQLHLDEDQAVADYLSAIGANQPGGVSEVSQQTFPLEIREERPPVDTVAQVPWGWLAVGLLIAALAFSSWSLYSRRSRADVKATPPNVDVAPQVATTPAVANTPSEKVSPPEPRPSSSSPPAAAVVAAPVTPTGSFTVLVKAAEDSWVSITADGKEIMQDTLVAPAEKSATAKKEIVIKAGNVGALQFSFNGRALPVQGDTGQVKTVTFGPAGLKPPPPAPQPNVPPS